MEVEEDNARESMAIWCRKAVGQFCPGMKSRNKCSQVGKMPQICLGQLLQWVSPSPPKQSPLDLLTPSTRALGLPQRKGAQESKEKRWQKETKITAPSQQLQCFPEGELKASPVWQLPNQTQTGEGHTKSPWKVELKDAYFAARFGQPCSFS